MPAEGRPNGAGRVPMSAGGAGGEGRRLAALRALGILDTPPARHFDRITALAQRLFDAPIAVVTFVDAQRQWFKSHPGLKVSETPRERAFCATTIAGDAVLVVPDARADPRFAQGPLVTEEPFVRFYAGCPLHADGSRVGTLAVMDRRPRTLSPSEVDLLRDLAGVVESALGALEMSTIARLPIGVYRSTQDGRIVDANPALVAMLGYPDRETLLASSAWDIYPDPAEGARLLARAEREGGLRGVETEVRRMDGRRLWVRLNTFQAREEAGAAVFHVGTIEDVTERRLAEEALWESEARLKLVLDQTPAVLWATDTELRFTMGEGAALASLNLRPNQLAGTSLFAYFGTSDPDYPPIAAHRRALAGEAVSYHADWAGRTYESHVRPLFGSAGSVLGALGIALDVTDRKRLEEDERRRAGRLRGLMETSLTAGSAPSLEDALQAISEGACALLGARSVVTTATGTEAVAAITAAAHAWEPAAHERGPAGAPEEGTAAAPLTGSDGSQLGVIQVLGRQTRDLTEDDEVVLGQLAQIASAIIERKRAEEALHHRERQMRAVLESALDAVIGMDAHGRITDWNARAQQIFGWSRAEALGREVAELIMPARHRNDHRRGLRHFLATGEGPILGRRVETAALRRDGSEFPVDLSVSVLREGGACSFSAFVSDISERKRAEEAFRDGEERYRVLYERERAGRERADRLRSATSALGSTLELGTVLSLILRELQRVVPYDTASVQELRGDWMEVIAGHGFALLDRVLGVRFNVRTADNPNHQVFMSRAPVFLDDAPSVFPEFNANVVTVARSWMGVPLLFGERLIGMLSLDKNQPGFYTPEHVHLAESFAAPAAIALENARLYAAARDELEERKRVEEQFRQSQKMEAIGRLAGGIAHDFNNLLGVILGYTELAGRRLGDESAAAAPLEQIRKAAERAAALTGQLLAFSRKQVLMPEVLDLSAFITDLSTMLHRVIGEDVELVTVLHEGLGMVRADRGQMGQALVNLAVNARDAMPRGGKLVIEAENVELPGEQEDAPAGLPPGPYVMLSIGDTGCGMSAEVLGHIFEPFFTTKEQGKGTGLGLSMVYGFLKQSGGHVGVASAAGSGTTVRLYLPALGEDARPSPGPMPDADPGGGSETILLVEDEASLRGMIAEVLIESGYRVLQAHTAEDALQLAHQHRGPIDLLLTDVVMPGMGGAELAEALYVPRPATRVLFMSGYTEDVVLTRGVLAEEVALIQKPFNSSTLLHRIRETLGRPAQE
jgi:two-component system, cell cycle sensor histidine kinase and response regulator CckA